MWAGRAARRGSYQVWAGCGCLVPHCVIYRYFSGLDVPGLCLHELNVYVPSDLRHVRESETLMYPPSTLHLLGERGLGVVWAISTLQGCMARRKEVKEGVETLG